MEYNLKKTNERELNKNINPVEGIFFDYYTIGKMIYANNLRYKK